MLEIDGSMGEGGGQILRSSVALSTITATPLRIRNIRKARSRPGLMRQHLTAVLAAAELCGAEVDGAQVGSSVLTFLPGPIAPGNYSFSIGSAGSTNLVLQTILPVLMTAGEPSTVQIEGGTHNIYAPPADFLEHAFLPLIRRMGPSVDFRVDRIGFYPAGGGLVDVSIKPAQLRPIHLSERGEIVACCATAVVSALPWTVAERELAVVRDKLGWGEESLHAADLGRDRGPGNILTIRIESEHVTEVFTGFGQRGVPAETVASHAADEAADYLAKGVPVGEHLADQLLLPLALAGGGSFVTMRPSLHTVTNIEVIEKFLPVRIESVPSDGDQWRISVGPK